MFFNGWEPVLRSFVLALLAYLTLITLLRFFGKRTLSKMNAFDFVITIALGSSLATIPLSRNVTLMEGAAVFLTFISLQFAVAWLSARFQKFESIIKNKPRLLFYNGNFFEESLKKERVTHEEILAAVREKGYGDLHKVKAVVIENDGGFTVLGEMPTQNFNSLSNVKGFHFFI